MLSRFALSYVNCNPKRSQIQKKPSERKLLALRPSGSFWQRFLFSFSPLPLPPKLQHERARPPFRAATLMLCTRRWDALLHIPTLWGSSAHAIIQIICQNWSNFACKAWAQAERQRSARHGTGKAAAQLGDGLSTKNASGTALCRHRGGKGTALHTG